MVKVLKLTPLRKDYEEDKKERAIHNLDGYFLKQCERVIKTWLGSSVVLGQVLIMMNFGEAVFEILNIK